MNDNGIEWLCDTCYHYNLLHEDVIYEAPKNAYEVEDYCACCDSIQWISIDDYIEEIEKSNEPDIIDDRIMPGDDFEHGGYL
jgi:hypothetical protein